MGKADSWLEVSLVVDGEMAEAVTEVLARYVSGGVAIESTGVTADGEDEGGHAVGPLRVCGYLPVDEQLEAARHRVEEALWHLGQIRPLPEAQFRPIQEQDWAEAWKQHYKPVAIGERLLIVPAWLDVDQPGRVPVKIDPGMAFGTGTHPTTQLCLEALDEILGTYQKGTLPGHSEERSDEESSSTHDEIQRVAQNDKQVGHSEERSDEESLKAHQGILRFSFMPQDKAQNDTDIIDVGCGSGILSIAALKLEARHALAVDIDTEAVEAAHQNAELNQVLERLELGQGSVGEILSGQFSLCRARLVVANILAPVLVRLFEAGLGELVASDGRLILSGILAEQAGEVLEAAGQHGFRLETERRSGDWVALVVRREK
jgi:ribosomal protein L11 methylase PrmA